MDTVARHPLTSLAAVAAFVALSLWLRFRPDPPRIAAGTFHLPTAGVGEQTEVSGRVTVVTTNTQSLIGGGAVARPVLLLDLGRGEAVCAFPVAEDPAGVRVGDAVTVGGRVNEVQEGRVYLIDCKLIPAPKP